MDAVASYPRLGLRFPLSSSSTKLKLSNPIFLRKEIADGPSSISYRKDLVQLTACSIRADGNSRGRPSRKDTGGKAKGDEGEKSLSSDGLLPTQKAAVALFRRIQSSISKRESVGARKRSFTSSEDNMASSESVLEVLRQSWRPGKEKTLNKKDSKVLSRRRDTSEEEQKKVDIYPSVIRPLSSFVKRSPIPSTTSPSGKDVELKSDDASAVTVVGDKELQKIEKMKLPALKELAKSRGIKGYSKLKKSELVQLLKS